MFCVRPQLYCAPPAFIWRKILFIMKQEVDESLLVLIGNNIQRFRKFRNISQQILAVITGISQGDISKIEAGKINMGLTTLSSIASGLNVSMAYLLLRPSQTVI